MSPKNGPDHLADLLIANGSLTNPGWEAAIRAVRRHEFLPPVVWVRDTDDPNWRSPYGPDTPEWRDAAYADYALVTQVDDGHPTGPGGRGRYPTSSASQPSLVVTMLQALDASPGTTVLEIGTATGYTCALLSHHLGDEHVTSVEIDPRLAGQARRNLHNAGYKPRLVVGDGARPIGGEPFDRVLSTVAAKHVPGAWVSQLRPGGVLVTPWGSDHAGHWLLRLVADGNGAAHGRIIGPAPFMWLRSQRSHTGRWRDHVDVDAPMIESRTSLDPRETLRGDSSGRAITIGTLVPDLYQHVIYDRDRAEEFTVWVYDAAGSWTAADYVPGAEDWLQSGYGPRDLWAEITAAREAWERSGRPGRDRLGVTVTADGHQSLWVDDPHSPIASGGTALT